MLTGSYKQWEKYKVKIVLTITYPLLKDSLEQGSASKFGIGPETNFATRLWART